jgi:PAS domain S-box-containing protein
MPGSQKAGGLKTVIKWRNHCDESFLVNVLESMYDAVIVINAEGTIVYGNRAYAREIGIQADNLLGMKMADIAPDAICLKVLKSGRAFIEQPHRIPRVNIDIVCNSVPLYKEGALVGAVSIFRNVTEVKRLNEELERMKNITDHLKEQLFPEGFKDIVGNNRDFRNMLSRAIKASRSDITVLVQGESGTGKDLLARAIHNAGRRKRRPFIAINCAAIPENLIESELFGFEEGAFTGARKGGKHGKFELADGGTLFLDEIGDMSMVLQVKLLRAIQEKEIERVGGIKSIRTDVRIIASTNQNLQAFIDQKKFRTDLFYRLNVFSINMMPLRKRADDIPTLCAHFQEKFAAKDGKKKKKLSSSALKVLMGYDWPGNVRELQNVIESAMISSDNEYIQAEDLPEYLPSMAPVRHSGDRASTGAEEMNFEKRIGQLEWELILQALKKTGNNRSRAIRMLGISRSAFYEKMAKHGIEFRQ